MTIMAKATTRWDTSLSNDGPAQERKKPRIEEGGKVYEAFFRTYTLEERVSIFGEALYSR
jgi:hypothetical protein